MTLKLAVRIEGDASGLKPAAEEARREIQGVGAAAAQAADEIDRALSPNAPARPPAGAPPAPAPRTPPAPTPAPNVVPFPAPASAAASGLRQHEWVNLSRQMQDVLTMGAMGASPMQIISSQGAQIFDIFTSAQAGPAAALRAVAPYAAAIAGLGATFGVAGKAAYDFSRSQTDVERSLRGIGRLSGASVEGINQIAAQNADAAKVSVASARSMSATFASVGRIGQERFGELTVVAARMGKTLGIDASEAADRLAQAFSGDVLKGAEELNKTFGFLSGRTAEMIEKQVAMGDRTGAIKTATDALKTSLVGVTDNTNAWAMAWDKVSRAAANTYDAMGKALQRQFAPTLAEQIEDQRARMDAPARRGLDPRQRAARERRLGTTDQDVLDELLERKMWEDINRTMGQRQAETADVTLRARGIVGQLTPTTADINQLREWKTTLEKALEGAQAPSGTVETLERVKKLLAEGGREASRLREAADDAFRVAGLLPYQRALAEIELRYGRLIKQASGNVDVISGLEKARDVEKSTVRVANTDNVVRDQRMRIDEQSASLRVQRDSLFASSEAAATLAARQELVNEAVRNGQTPAERYGGQLDALAAQMGKLKAAEEEFQRIRTNIVGGMDDIRSGAQGLMTSPFGALIRGQNPAQALLSSLQGTADRMFERLVAKPLTDQLFGVAGKPGGGIFGDLIGQSGIFGSLTGMTTASMAVNAAVVNIGGAGIGASLTGGVPGTTGSTSSGLPITVQPNGSAGGGWSLPFGLSAGGGGTGSGAGGAGTFDRSGWPYSALNSSATSAAQSLDKVDAASSDAASGLGSLASKLIDRLPSGVAFPGAQAASAGATDYTDVASWFATGGIMTSRGRLPLHTYSKGGVATEPQLAVFGEARMPEAYVPLPDGRSIPVSMKMPTFFGAANSPPPAVKNEVHVYNAPAGTTVKESQGPRGARTEIAIGDMINAHLMSPAARPIWKAMGINRMGTGS